MIDEQPEDFIDVLDIVFKWAYYKKIFCSGAKAVSDRFVYDYFFKTIFEFLIRCDY